MKFRLPKILLYLMRFTMVLAVVLSLCFLTRVTTAYIYLVVIAVGICEWYLSLKSKLRKFGAVEKQFFGAIDRFIMILPFLFFVIWGELVWWVFVIVVLFEISRFVCVDLNYDYGKYTKTKRLIDAVCDICLYVSIFGFLLNINLISKYSLFVACVASAVFVVFSAVVVKGKQKQELSKQEENLTDIINPEENEQNGEIIE